MLEGNKDDEMVKYTLNLHKPLDLLHKPSPKQFITQKIHSIHGLTN